MIVPRTMIGTANQKKIHVPRKKLISRKRKQFTRSTGSRQTHGKCQLSKQVRGEHVDFTEQNGRKMRQVSTMIMAISAQHRTHDDGDEKDE